METVVVCCIRVEDLDDPMPGSVQVSCRGCGTPLWYHFTTIPSDREALAYCRACCPEPGPIMFTPGQVDLLHAVGYSRRNVAQLLAAMRLTNGDPDLLPNLMTLVVVSPTVAALFETETRAALVDLFG